MELKQFMKEEIDPGKDTNSETRRRGAQPGNTNALKHGFYSRTWKLSDTNGLDKLKSKSLDEEVALLRVYIRRLIEMEQDDADLQTVQDLVRTLSLACQTILRMLKAQTELHEDDESELRQVIDQAIREVTHEMGIDKQFPS